MNTAMAKIKTQKVEYKSGDLTFEAFISRRDTHKE
jgi:hypothetical protein